MKGFWLNALVIFASLTLSLTVVSNGRNLVFADEVPIITCWNSTNNGCNLVGQCPSNMECDMYFELNEEGKWELEGCPCVWINPVD